MYGLSAKTSGRCGDVTVSESLPVTIDILISLQGSGRKGKRRTACR